MRQPMKSRPLLVSMVGPNGLHVAEVTIESVLCSYLEEDALEAGVVRVQHETSSTLAKKSGCSPMLVELLMKMLHYQDI